ncbi:hypothetical protein KUG12_28140 [Streptomyces sp. BV333]|uniref:hypothetical protein n=1 Tax=Streptomyces sp. BV333 TaxID=2849673 RepID=UPI001C2E181B|nr:hypothetical protein [Streptomyces sp. BV333]MBV1958145.1 hypothetical protein [Streptomyces sp. BV333]
MESQIDVRVTLCKKEKVQVIITAFASQRATTAVFNWRVAALEPCRTLFKHFLAY